MKILYVHGLGSGSGSNTAKMLTNFYKNDNTVQILAPEIPIQPEEAFKYIQSIAGKERPNIIIGTSLGAFYARYIHGPIKILINPAMQAKDIVSAVGYGQHKFLVPRIDQAVYYNIDDSFIGQLNKINLTQSSFIDDEMLLETYGLFGTKDTFLNNLEYFKSIYRPSHAYIIDSAHRLSNENIKEDLIPLIEIFKKELTRD